MAGRQTVRTRFMDATEIAKLRLDLAQSIEMRKLLDERLARKEEIDLVEELAKLEQLDLVIASRIRKWH